MITPSLLEPLKNMAIEYIPILFGAMIGFVALVWASKKLLYFLDISDFAIGRRIAKEEKRAKNFKQKNKIHNSFLKTKQTKTERERRKRLYQLKQLRSSNQEKSRIKKSEIQRAKYEAIKEAHNMRINEKIKESKKQVLNEKINSKLDSRYFKLDDEGKSYIFTYAT